LENQLLLEAEGIVKIFPGVRAVDHVDFDLKHGEVHVLIGENGAGKSTLVKTFLGVHEPDEGIVRLDGEQIRLSSTRAAYLAGIAAVFQEFNLIPVLNVAQNIYLGREPRKPNSPFVDEEKMHADAREYLDLLNLDVDTHVRIEDLGVAQQQMVEIARALSMNAKVLILDEPTASLTQQEIKQLFHQIEGLKARGVGIIYISHRLEEVFELGDRVTVLRDGQKIGTWDIADVDMNSLITAMVGREIDRMYSRNYREPGDVILSVECLSRTGLLRDINLTVRAGEIVGLAGLIGSGRTDLVRTIFGADRADDGCIEILGEPCHIKSMNPTRIVNRGVAMLPESRKEDGLALALPLGDNVVMASLKRLFPNMIISNKKQTQVAETYVEELRIDCRSVQQLASSLSGGTQQKVVVSKWLASESRLLLFDEPTRGIDVGSKAEIHALMNDLVKEGAGILMVSSELPELLGMSDRIYVMRQGEIVAELSRREANQEKILAHMMGVDDTNGNNKH
jgi:ribose transport system ATP-binding protein